MARIDDKIAATAFTVRTLLSFDQVLAIADEAARVSSRTVDTVVRTDAKPTGSVIRYDVKRARLVSMGDFGVLYEWSDSTQDALVSFLPGSYMTSQSRVMLIPIAPKDSAAYKPFKRASDSIKGALGASRPAGAADSATTSTRAPSVGVNLSKSAAPVESYAPAQVFPRAVQAQSSSKRTFVVLGALAAVIAAVVGIGVAASSSSSDTYDSTSSYDDSSLSDEGDYYDGSTDTSTVPDPTETAGGIATEPGIGVPINVTVKDTNGVQLRLRTESGLADEDDDESVVIDGADEGESFAIECVAEGFSYSPENGDGSYSSFARTTSGEYIAAWYLVTDDGTRLTDTSDVPTC